jgi:uncharacterized protein YukE
VSSFEAIPHAVEGAGTSLRGSATRIVQLRGSLEAAQPAGDATGDGAAAAAFGRMLTAWSTELARLSTVLEGIGDAARGGARAYVATDAAQMRTQGPGR